MGKEAYMDNVYNRIGFISGSSMKMIACLFMAIDHIGLSLFPEYEIFRILGRIAFPIFAFFIAEGCKYPKNKVKRFALLFVIGMLYLLFYIVYDGMIYGNIFLTFSVSVAVIYITDFLKKWVFDNFKICKVIFSLLFMTVLLFALYILFKNVHFEYGFSGMLVPVFVSLVNFRDVNVPKWIERLDDHFIKLLLMALGLVILGYNGRLGDIQFYAFLSLPILALYNGLPGIKGTKYLFYIFYPAHLALIEGISMVITYFGQN